MKIKNNLKQILNRKSKGNMLLNIAIIFPFILIIMYYLISTFVISEQASTVKDKADFTNLSVYKNINQQELSTEGKITFEATDLNNAYNTYVTYLRSNLGLDSNLNVISTDSYIKGNVKINKFIIYKVKDGLTTEWDYDNSTGTFNNIHDSTPLTIETPNNKTVNKTSVYSELLIPIDFPFVKVQNVTLHTYTDAVN